MIERKREHVCVCVCTSVFECVCLLCVHICVHVCVWGCVCVSERARTREKVSIYLPV